MLVDSSARQKSLALSSLTPSPSRQSLRHDDVQSHLCSCLRIRGLGQPSVQLRSSGRRQFYFQLCCPRRIIACQWLFCATSPRMSSSYARIIQAEPHVFHRSKSGRLASPSRQQTSRLLLAHWSLSSSHRKHYCLVTLFDLYSTNILGPLLTP